MGGGGAGCFAGIFSARDGETVTIIEPNDRLGKKLSITGKGRCNITNACDLDTFIKNVPRNAPFLYSAVSRFDSSDCMSSKKEIDSLGVSVARDRASEIVCVDSDEGKKAVGVVTENGYFEGEKVILATGGLSYPATGSTGDGYKLARRLGHTITELTPSLVPLETEESCLGMDGVNVKNALFTVYDSAKNKKIFTEQGEFTFESYGLGGPLTLSGP